MPLRIAPALAAVCRRHGIETDGRSPDELVQLVPDMIAALRRDQVQNAERCRRVVEKTALAVNVIRSTNIPNPGIVRDEYLPTGPARPAKRTNDVFDDFGLFDALSEGNRE